MEGVPLTIAEESHVLFEFMTSQILVGSRHCTPNENTQIDSDHILMATHSYYHDMAGPFGAIRLAQTSVEREDRGILFYTFKNMGPLLRRIQQFPVVADLIRKNNNENRMWQNAVNRHANLKILINGENGNGILTLENVNYRMFEKCMNLPTIDIRREVSLTITDVANVWDSGIWTMYRRIRDILIPFTRNPTRYNGAFLQNTTLSNIHVNYMALIINFPERKGMLAYQRAGLWWRKDFGGNWRNAAGPEWSDNVTLEQQPADIAILCFEENIRQTCTPDSSVMERLENISIREMP